MEYFSLFIFALPVLPTNGAFGDRVLSLRLFDWRCGHLCLSNSKGSYQLWGAGLLVMAAILLPYKLTTTEFGPLITVTQAKQLATFNYVDGYYGRSFFFSENPLIFWLFGPRSGLLFWGIFSPLALTGLALPVLLNQPQKFPVAKRVSPQIYLLVQVVWAGLGLFFSGPSAAVSATFSQPIRLSQSANCAGDRGGYEPVHLF
ncbi:MAG: hypothetical protein HC886_15275 [Leptolyngbyaceae cyanobacterium SM1_1_3]|nr:hypothetical protein [Leptolyngbyaceae cyanobacterium SM1_1_3]NJM85678.1 hypothetical protein [Leptolyngbyaceae cyanobacterium RM2_2_21]